MRTVEDFILGFALVALVFGCGSDAALDAETSSAETSGAATLVYEPRGARDSAQNPTFSPDGATVLFTIWHHGYNGAPAGIFTVPASGGAATKVIDEGASDVNLPGASWNAKTNRITFASDRDDGPDEIYTSDPDGKNLTRVTRHTGSKVYIEPSFSPEGKHIVFEADVSDTAAELWIVGVDGNGLRRLTSGKNDREPNWSPDGSRILFQRFTSDWALYTIAPDGTGLFRVTPPGYSATDASWSPDGTRVVYSAGTSDIAGANIFVSAATGGTPVRVTRSSGYDGAVSWSPDGAWLAFESSSDPSGEARTRIMKIRAPR